MRSILNSPHPAASALPSGKGIFKCLPIYFITCKGSRNSLSMCDALLSQHDPKRASSLEMASHHPNHFWLFSSKPHHENAALWKKGIVHKEKKKAGVSVQSAQSLLPLRVPPWAVVRVTLAPLRVMGFSPVLGQPGGLRKGTWSLGRCPRWCWSAFLPPPPPAVGALMN